MEINYNFPKDNIHINNLAFVRALFIKNTIEQLEVSLEEKQMIRQEILEYLKKT